MIRLHVSLTPTSRALPIPPCMQVLLLPALLLQERLCRRILTQQGLSHACMNGPFTPSLTCPKADLSFGGRSSSDLCKAVCSNSCMPNGIQVGAEQQVSASGCCQWPAILNGDAPTECHRQASHGPCNVCDAARHHDSLCPYVQQAHFVAARHRPCRHCNPGVSLHTCIADYSLHHRLYIPQSPSAFSEHAIHTLKWLTHFSCFSSVMYPRLASSTSVMTFSCQA